jgi:hypothetical protein
LFDLPVEEVADVEGAISTSLTANLGSAPYRPMGVSDSDSAELPTVRTAIDCCPHESILGEVEQAKGIPGPWLVEVG